VTPQTPALSIIQRSVWGSLPALALPAGARVLDAPCGEGALSLALRHAGLDVLGVDMQDQARKWLCIEGIEHLENRFLFLREARRILRPGGKLVLTTPNTVALRSRMRFFGSGFYHRDSRPLNEARHHPLHHIGLATFADWRYALHTSGFSLSTVAATHVKPVSWPYVVFVPWMYLYTLLAFRKEKDPAQRERNLTIRRTLFSRALLFGENLLLVALAHNK
jgi:hypothetical protein